jgi:hypothetical protein
MAGRLTKTNTLSFSPTNADESAFSSTVVGLAKKRVKPRKRYQPLAQSRDRIIVSPIFTEQM